MHFGIKMGEYEKFQIPIDIYLVFGKYRKGLGNVSCPFVS